MNSCFRVKGLLSAYLDRELSGEEMMLLRDHVSGCADCATEFEELRHIKGALIQLPAVEVSDDLLARMKANVFQPIAPVPVSKPKVAATLGMAAAVLFLMCAVLKWVDVQRQTDVNMPISLENSRAVASGMDDGPAFTPVSLANSPE